MEEKVEKGNAKALLPIGVFLVLYLGLGIVFVRRQGDQEFKVILCYIRNLGLSDLHDIMSGFCSGCLKLKSLLPQPPKYLDYRYVSRLSQIIIFILFTCQIY